MGSSQELSAKSWLGWLVLVLSLVFLGFPGQTLIFLIDLASSVWCPKLFQFARMPNNLRFQFDSLHKFFGPIVKAEMRVTRRITDKEVSVTCLSTRALHISSVRELSFCMSNPLAPQIRQEVMYGMWQVYFFVKVYQIKNMATLQLTSYSSMCKEI